MHRWCARRCGFKQSVGREFCCLEHLRAYNADCADWAVVPMRRRQECPIVDLTEASKSDGIGMEIGAKAERTKQRLQVAMGGPEQ
eukprot:4589018-Pleurochrysis_carterae.AAC.7